MEKSHIEKIKDVLLYAPVGALGFMRDNAPTFFSMFVSRGKREVNKTAAATEEKLATTKEHGQFVAMGTPVVKTQAEKITSEAKSKGEDLAHVSIDMAMSALGFLEDQIKSFASKVNDQSPPVTSEPVARPKNVSSDQDSHSSSHSSQGALPQRIEDDYALLSAPEIIDRLSEFTPQELDAIRQFEQSNRNRQTVIHAITFRLNN